MNIFVRSLVEPEWYQLGWWLNRAPEEKMILVDLEKVIFDIHTTDGGTLYLTLSQLAERATDKIFYMRMGSRTSRLNIESHNFLKLGRPQKNWSRRGEFIAYESYAALMESIINFRGTEHTRMRHEFEPRHLNEYANLIKPLERKYNEMNDLCQKEIERGYLASGILSKNEKPHENGFYAEIWG